MSLGFLRRFGNLGCNQKIALISELNFYISSFIAARMIKEAPPRGKSEGSRSDVVVTTPVVRRTRSSSKMKRVIGDDEAREARRGQSATTMRGR